jgi:hypothetical protein
MLTDLSRLTESGENQTIDNQADLAEVITDGGSAFLMMAKRLINGKDR